MTFRQTLPNDRLLAEFSLWSANLVALADDIARVDTHVDIYHGDVSDGRFSPSLLLFPDMMAQIRPLTDKLIHIHLMLADDVLLDQIDQFAEVGADIISIHAENANRDAGLERIANHGCSTGIALQLHTPVENVAGLLDRIDILTLLGTQLGIKGVGLDESAPSRLAAAREMIGRRDILLAADGGIREHTVPALRAAGADTIVMGSLAFGAEDLEKRMAWVHALAGPS
ncbi:MAG: D-allulose-6-phosphate 3-epimerase [Pseudomonadota bacterium]